MSMTPQPHIPHHSASPVPTLQRPPSYQTNGINRPYVPQSHTPVQTHVTPAIAQPQLHAPASLAAAHPISYTGATPSQPYRPPLPTAPSQPYVQFGGGIHDPRAREVYILSEHANQAIPKDIRDQFPQDDQGHVLFFTKPPIKTNQSVKGRRDKEDKLLEHSEAYNVAAFEKNLLIAERKRVLQYEEKEQRASSPKRRKSEDVSHLPNGTNGHTEDEAVDEMDVDTEKISQTSKSKSSPIPQPVSSTPATTTSVETQNSKTARLSPTTSITTMYKQTYGSDWETILKQDSERKKIFDQREDAKARKQKEIRDKMQYMPILDTNWQTSLWGGNETGTSRYADDLDPRY